MKGYGGASRRELFERFDRPALQPLPAERFVHADWRQARVNIDYHVEVDRHYYSVPHPLIHAPSRSASRRRPSKSFSAARASGSMCAAIVPGRHTTIPEHMPKAHRAHLEWSPSRLVRWGATIGPAPRRSSSRFSRAGRIPSKAIARVSGCCAWRSSYGPARLDAACARAVAAGARSYRHVESILKHGLDRQPLLLETAATPPRARPTPTSAAPPTTTKETPHAD